MAIFLLINLFWLSFEARSLASVTDPVEITYEIAIGVETISGTRKSGTKIESFSFKTEEEEPGLILVNPRVIAKSLGDSALADTHSFSYADPKKVRVNLKLPKGYFSFSSFYMEKGDLNPRKVSQFVVGAAKKNMWTKTRFVDLGTNFELVSPVTNSNIEPNHWKTSVSKIWKEFSKRFGVPTEHLVFLDLKGPISGGPLGENVLGIFANHKISPAVQEDMKANLGWSPQSSTRNYVKANYPNSSKNQWQEYLFGTFSHEIAHLFFGFGVTRERVVSVEELWFSLGLGIVYDMEVTEKLLGRKPQLELDIINSWESKYSRIPEIDQKLVKPNTSADVKYPFDRKKVFAHGKAAFYLGKLREKVGIDAFDQAVLNYLKCSQCVGGYEDFKKFLEKTSLVQELEKIYVIY
jgi:hypothetical protein